MPEQEQKRIQRKGGGDAGGDDAGQVTSTSKAEDLKAERD
jgi:hypothetical protein